MHVEPPYADTPILGLSDQHRVMYLLGQTRLHIPGSRLMLYSAVSAIAGAVSASAVPVAQAHYTWKSSTMLSLAPWMGIIIPLEVIFGMFASLGFGGLTTEIEYVVLNFVLSLVRIVWRVAFCSHLRCVSFWLTTQVVAWIPSYLKAAFSGLVPKVSMIWVIGQVMIYHLN